MSVIRNAIFLVLIGVGARAAAHDFWIQPTRWEVGPRESFQLRLEVGHGPYRQRSPIAVRRVIRFEAVAANGRKFDLRPRLQIGAPEGDANAGFALPGSYLVVLETDNRAESHLPAIRFNDYLNVEGLTPALAIRNRTGRANADGAENYSRHAKTILQVGPYDGRSQAQVIRPVGLQLEIVPERSPLGLAHGGQLPVRVYYYGRPLSGALVKLNNLDHDAEPIEMHRTDQEGRATFNVPGKGSWQLNVIWTRPQPASELTDFDTSFSSLSFGITG